MYSSLVRDTVGVFISHEGYSRCIHLSWGIQSVYSSLVRDTVGVFISHEGYSRCIHLS